MAWVYQMPLWLFAFLVIGGLSGLACAGLLFARKRLTRAEELTHNDVAGPVIGTLGTILAVMLSFMVITVWQEYDAAAATVQSEVNAVADLYLTASALPEPVRTKLHRDIIEYVHWAVRNEWPMMREGTSSSRTRDSLYAIMHDITRFPARGEREAAIQTASLSISQSLADARRQRLFANQQAIPHVMWVIMLLMGGVTIASVYLFRVASLRAHLLMTLSLAIVTSSVFVLIAQLDLPFRGDLQIPPSAFQHAYAAIESDPPPGVTAQLRQDVDGSR